jgi:hypothetical protein
MSTSHGFTALCIAIAALGSACAIPQSPSAPRAIDPDWQVHMTAGQRAAELGDLDAASTHYRRALGIARSEPARTEELAFSAYHLGDTLLEHPGTSWASSPRPRAIALLEESLSAFERRYGPTHPILMPVLSRIARARSSVGEHATAAAAIARTDRIAAHSFPESHFLRERFGATPSAEVLHPAEMLKLLRQEKAPAPALVAKERQAGF